MPITLLSHLVWSCLSIFGLEWARARRRFLTIAEVLDAEFAEAGRPLVLTDDQVDQIQAEYDAGKDTWQVVAARWGVTPKAIFRAKARRKKRAAGPVLPPVLGPYLEAASRSRH